MRQAGVIDSSSWRAIGSSRRRPSADAGVAGASLAPAADEPDVSFVEDERKPPARPLATSASNARITPQLTRLISAEGRLRQKISRPYQPKPVSLTTSSSASTLTTDSNDCVKHPSQSTPERKVLVGSAEPPSFSKRTTSAQSSNTTNSDGMSTASETTLQATTSQQLRASFSAPLGVEETQAILDQLRKQKQRQSMSESTTSESILPRAGEVASVNNNYSEDTKMSEDELLALEMSNASLHIPPASPPRGSLLKSTKKGSSSFRPKDPFLADDGFISLRLPPDSDDEMPMKQDDFETSINIESAFSKPDPYRISEPVGALSDEELARRLAEGLIEDVPVTEVPITRTNVPALETPVSPVADTSSAEQRRIWEQIQEEQERKLLERALEESRRTVGGSVDFVLSGNPSARFRHTGGEEMDILLSQQVALNEWAQRQQTPPPQRSASLSTNLIVPQPLVPRPSRQPTDSLAATGRVSSVGSARHNVGEIPEREDMLRRGQLETQQAISIGQAHIVQCQGCLGRLHAPLSYSLVFCPNCHTVSPGLPLQRNSSSYL